MHSVEWLHSTKYVAERVPQYFSCAWAVWLWIKSDSISNAMLRQYMRHSINTEIRLSSKDCKTSSEHQDDCPNCTAVHGSLSSNFSLLSPYHQGMSIIIIFSSKIKQKTSCFPIPSDLPVIQCSRTVSGLRNSNGVCSGPVSDSFAVRFGVL